MKRRSKGILIGLAAVPAGLLLAAAFLLGLSYRGDLSADWGAAVILHPMKRPLTRPPGLPHEDLTFTSGTERLEGWIFRATGERRGLVVYLHGIGRNRQSGIAVAERLVPRGYDVLTFDGRAHGRSSGAACTYGFHERHDVSRALDAVSATGAILLGHSLGAAIALQTAAVDRRVEAVIAASPFSDLPTIVRERARWFLAPEPYVEEALVRAGELGRFTPAEVSPLRLAPAIEAPVLLLHGEDDVKTVPDHSRRIFEALGGPRRLVVFPGVEHDEILEHDEVWQAIETFLEELAYSSACCG